MWTRVSELEQQINDVMDRVRAAGEDQEKRTAALENYLRLAYAHDDDEDFDADAWSEILADSHLALDREQEAVRTIRDATRRGYSEGAEMLCALAEKLMRSGHEPLARPLWDEARADFPDDVWVYVQAGIEYGDIEDHASALTWLTPEMELALRTGDPESALEQMIPLRAACLSTLGPEPDDLQTRAGLTRAEEGT